MGVAHSWAGFHGLQYPTFCLCVCAFYFTFPVAFAPSLTVILVEVTDCGRIIAETVSSALSSSSPHFEWICFNPHSNKKRICKPVRWFGEWTPWKLRGLVLVLDPWKWRVLILVLDEVGSVLVSSLIEGQTYQKHLRALIPDQLLSFFLFYVTFVSVIHSLHSCLEASNKGMTKVESQSSHRWTNWTDNSGPTSRLHTRIVWIPKGSRHPWLKIASRTLYPELLVTWGEEVTIILKEPNLPLS